MKVAPAIITELGPDDVFVFGSNLAGRHGKGAALTARYKFGAQNGVGQGFTGQCYALPTKDHRIATLPLEHIERKVAHFLDAARKHPAMTFLVTRVGCGEAGYTDAEIAPFFRNPPENVHLPVEFIRVLEERI